MEYFIDTERVSLDYSEERSINDIPSYRLTLYDKYGHFDADVYLTDEQIKDLLIGFDNIRKKNN